MRHFRISNRNINQLTTFKKQIGCMIKELNKFDQADKNEAITYLKKCINTRNVKGKCGNMSNPTLKLSKSITRKEPIKQNNVSSEKGLKSSSKVHKIIRSSFKSNTFVKRAILCCKLCHVKKRSLLNFANHLNLHIGTPISCRKCKQNFNGRLAFEFHLKHICGRNVPSKKTFKCPQCQSEFKFKRHLQSHIAGHKRNNCKYCDMVFTNKKYLIKHLATKHSVENYNETTKIHKCDYCDKRYIQKRSLFCHLKLHVPGKYVCLDCGLIIDELKEYKMHSDMHNKAKKWQCPTCEMRFLQKQHLYIHLKKHDKYKCITCTVTFASKIIAIQHKKKGHLVSGLEPKMMCPLCPKVYYRAFALQQHLKKHNGTSNTILCKYCEKSFLSEYQYYRHCLTVTHEKNSPDVSQLLCDICGKHFTKRYLLEDHIYRNHSKKDLLSCPHCEYKTKNRTNMKRHTIIHMPSEDFICEQCGKHFTNIFSLREHVSYSHVQVKRYKCDECEKSFKRKSELARHKRIHSDERPYVCKICGSSYKRNTHLTRHQRSAHKLMPTSKNSECGSESAERHLNVYQINVAELIPNGIPVAIPSIDQKTLNETLWNNNSRFESSQQEAFSPCTSGEQIYNTESINVDQLVASYIPEKSGFYQAPYTSQFDNVIISDIIVTPIHSNANNSN